MNIEELQNEWEKDCRIDDDFDRSSTTTPKLHAKYLRILINTKLKHTQLKSQYAELRKNKFRYYRGELSRDELSELGWNQWQGTKPLKTEMEQFLQGDSDLLKLETRMEYLEAMIYALESIMNQIKSRDWEIKNAITWKMFMAGN